ncbi:PaaI family thioesterase [Alicyclobacillus tolerans]|uniref:PaaI family thioesterase n=1 Tax=Alicyclobacillus tolerans TaxID=90970 RepID=UPI001F30B3F6|nr:PaaI family thioesterase [Alicyclobacillus tolerans]MCF8567206.1 PaaI family thioesterase [Alicyclobacillus tolerans]
MTKEELLEALEQFDSEDLTTALKAAEASRKTRRQGAYFLQNFFEETRVQGDERGTEITMPITPLVMNPGHMAHGGVIAFLCDNAMGMASFMEKQRPGVTMDLTVRYHKPLRGSFATARGEVVSSGSRINSTRCECRDETGTLVATATGSFYHFR